MNKSVGIVEWRSVAAGILGTDAMLKVADVDLLQSTTMCPGKYITIVGGDVASVTSAVNQGIEVGKYYLIDSIIIPNVHQSVFPALLGTTEAKDIISLGVIETFSAVGAVIAGDLAVKSADIILLEIRLARGMGGKALVLLTGSVESVRTAIKVGEEEAEKRGVLANSVIIPAAHKSLVDFIA